MSKNPLRLLLLLGLSICVSADAQLLRPPEMLSGYQVAGIYLSMTPTAALAALEAAGYTQTSARSDDASPGNPSVWTYRKGPSTVQVTRVGDAIGAISELYIRTDGTQFDVQAEYNKVKQHFAVGDNEQACQPPNQTGAVCGVVDDGQPYEYVFGIQILPTMRTTQLERVFRE